MPRYCYCCTGRAIATAGMRMPRYCYCWDANAALLLLLERECRATANATAINTVMQDAMTTRVIKQSIAPSIEFIRAASSHPQELPHLRAGPQHSATGRLVVLVRPGSTQ